MSVLGVPTFCIITGGDRGLGKGIATQIAKKLGPGSTLVMVCLYSSDETAKDIEGEVGGKVKIRCIQGDLSEEGNFAVINRSIFDDVDASSFESAIIIHNATKFDLTKYARELDDVTDLQKQTMLNISGPIVMTSEFLRRFSSPDKGVRKTIINISSEASWVPAKTTHLYGAYKAGRDQFFRVMALEESGTDLRILTYAPGTVDTPGFHAMATSEAKEIRAGHAFLMNSGGVLTPQESADVLIKTLEEDTYENGVMVRCSKILGMDHPVK